MDLNEHIRHKELFNMRESAKSDWRKDLETIEDGGDHPYVDIMPSSDAAEQIVKNKKKDKKKEEKEDVSEAVGLAAAGTALVRGLATAAKSPVVRRVVTGAASRFIAGSSGSDSKRDTKGTEKVEESIKDDPEHQKNFKAAADNVAKGMAERRKRLDLSTHKRDKK